MPLVVVHGEVLMPFEERDETILRIFFRRSVDFSWVPQEKIQRRPRDRSLSDTRFELMIFPFAAVISYDFFNVREVKIRCRNRACFLLGVLFRSQPSSRHPSV